MPAAPPMRERLLEAEFAERLRMQRNRLLKTDKRMSARAVAREIGVSGAALSNWENAKAMPNTIARWQRWALAVGMRFQATLAGDD